jgi:hypothetical protein
VAKAPPWVPLVAASGTDEKKAEAEAAEQVMIDGLARLSPTDYDRQRTDRARDLGVRRSTLDNEVEARRAQQQQDAGHAPLFGHWVVKPADEAVDTDALLLQIQRRLQRHIVFSLDQAVVTAAWVLFAWIHEVATHSPKLLVTSAVGDCGKSTLLSLIGYLVPRALSCVDITEAPLFRSVEYWSPTLLIDEADKLLVNNEPVRAIVNGSWAKGFGVVRCIGDAHIPHFFPIFCPQAIGMVGKRLPHTTLSRSIVIEMNRKLDSESAEHFDLLDDADLMQLRQQALRWSLDTIDQLRNARPQMPDKFQNRLGDNYRTLFAIADHAGGDWPELVRTAAQRLSGVADIGSRQLRLLAAIRDAFADREAVSSADLIGWLTADETSEWTDWRDGKPISQAQLARVLRDFRVHVERIMIDGRQQRGYVREKLAGVWKRYLPPKTPFESV